jgi:hypothetical protein
MQIGIWRNNNSSHGTGRKPDAITAIVLALAFAAWLTVLAIRLSLEFDARVHYDVAALPSAAVLITNYAAWALAPLLILCAYFLREKPNGNDSGITGVFLNLLAMLLGCGIGWGLGVFLVPFDDVDGAIYSKIGAGVATFLSGYVVSYLPDFIKTQLSRRNSAFLVQVGLGAAALIVTGLAVSTNRTEYLEFAKLERADETVVNAREKATIEAVKAQFECERSSLRNKRLARQTVKVPLVQHYIKTKGDTGAPDHSDIVQTVDDRRCSFKLPAYRE